MKTRRRTWIYSLLAIALLLGVLALDGPAPRPASDAPPAPGAAPGGQREPVAQPSAGAARTTAPGVPGSSTSPPDAGVVIQPELSTVDSVPAAVGGGRQPR